MMRDAEHPMGYWIVLIVFVFAAQMLLYLPYVTDDTYIYARFAENLAERGELAFNPGEPVHAATSPLWAALGAIGATLGVDAVVFLRISGMLTGGLALIVFARAARRWLGPGRWALLTTLLLAVEPWFVRWSASGMETPLAVLLVVSMIEAGGRAAGEVAWRRVALSAGVLPLVRPEGVLLLGLVGLAMLRSPEARRRLSAWVLLLLPLAVWSAWAVPHYGHVLPATLQAKSTPLGLRPERLLANLRVLIALYGVAALLPSLAWLVGLVRGLGTIRTGRGAVWIEPVLWAWTLLLPMAYLLRDVQVVSRYVELVLPVVLLLGAAWLQQRLRAAVRLGAWTTQALMALVLTVTWISPNARAFGRTLESGLGDIAGWLSQNSEPDEVVAIYDIGLVGARSDRRILDLGGLVHPGINDLRNEVDDAEILHDGLFLRFDRPQFLVDRDFEADVLDGRILGGKVRCEALLSREVANLGLSRGRPVVYTLYRLRPVG